MKLEGEIAAVVTGGASGLGEAAGGNPSGWRYPPASGIAVL